MSSHTDSRGSNDANKTLSEKRAKAAVDYLIEKDIEKEQRLKRERDERDNRIARRILEKQKEAKAKALNEKLKLEQEFERERLTAEMREKERIAKEMANQERKAIEKAERERREKIKFKITFKK